MMSTEEGKTQVIILTPYYRIIGNIAHFSDARLTDYMVEAKSFIAVTNAEVMGHDGSRIFSTDFLNVQRESIEIITPYEMTTLD